MTWNVVYKNRSQYIHCRHNIFWQLFSNETIPIDLSYVVLADPFANELSRKNRPCIRKMILKLKLMGQLNGSLIWRLEISLIRCNRKTNCELLNKKYFGVLTLPYFYDTDKCYIQKISESKLCF